MKNVPPLFQDLASMNINTSNMTAWRIPIVRTVVMDSGRATELFNCPDLFVACSLWVIFRFTLPPGTLRLYYKNDEMACFRLEDFNVVRERYITQAALLAGTCIGVTLQADDSIGKLGPFNVELDGYRYIRKA